jgi:hypothetical protein
VSQVEYRQVFLDQGRHPPDGSFMAELHDEDAWFDMEVTSADYEPTGPSPALLRRRRIVLGVALGSSAASIVALVAMAAIVLRAPPREAAAVAAAADVPDVPVVAEQAAPVAVLPAPPLPAATIEITMPVDRVRSTPRRRAVRRARVAHAPAAAPTLRKLPEAALAPTAKIVPASAPSAPAAPAAPKPRRFGHFN